jgi:hypothetical protein
MIQKIIQLSIVASLYIVVTNLELLVRMMHHRFDKISN